MSKSIELTLTDDRVKITATFEELVKVYRQWFDDNKNEPGGYPDVDAEVWKHQDIAEAAAYALINYIEKIKGETA